MKAPLETQRALRRERSERSRKAAPQIGQAYPQVQKIRLDLVFTDHLVRAPAGQTHLLYPPARAFFQFPCPHADCSGQIDLDGIITSAINASMKTIDGELICPGVRPERGATSRNCKLHVQYRMTVIYR